MVAASWLGMHSLPCSGPAAWADGEFFMQFESPFGLNALMCSLRTEEEVLGSHPLSFRNDSTGLKLRIQSWVWV